MTARPAEKTAQTVDPDAKFAEILNALDQGFCTIEVLFDTDGVAKDYRFLQVNDAFEQQAGLRDFI